MTSLRSWVAFLLVASCFCEAAVASGPLFSRAIPHASAEQASSSDFVEKFRVPDGSSVRVLIKAPHPARPAKIMHVAAMAAGETANAYFARAIAAATAGGYGTVVFPKGTYKFVAPTPPNSSHWVIKSVHDLTIDGQGSTLNFASPRAGGVTISGSQRILFEDFNIDWPDTLMASVGTVISIDKKKNPATMRVRIRPQYHVVATTEIIALSPWDERTDPRNPHLALKNFQKEEYVLNRSTRYLGGNTFEVPYWNNYIAVGDVFLVRHFGWSPWRSAVETGGSHDIDFERVNIYASPYLGFSLSSGGGYRLSHCSVTRLNAARLISSEADAIHIADNTGDILIEDGTFAYQGDDGLNIHGALGGLARAGENVVQWTVTGEGSYAPYSWSANDTIGFFDHTLRFLGTTSFRSLAHAKSGLEINLRGEAPAGAAMIANLSKVSARFIVRRNQFLYNRARGMLLESSLGLVENNTFIGQTAQGLIVGVALASEGPGVQEVSFRGNRFSNIGSILTNHPNTIDGAALVAVQGDAQNAKSNVPVFEDLLFESNIFSDLPGPGLFISRANEVDLVGNEFVNTNLVPSTGPGLGTASLAGSVVVIHARNVKIEKTVLRGAKTGPVSVDRTSTGGISH